MDKQSNSNVFSEFLCSRIHQKKTMRRSKGIDLIEKIEEIIFIFLFNISLFATEDSISWIIFT